MARSTAIPASDRRTDGWSRLKSWWLAAAALRNRLRKEPVLPSVDVDEAEGLKRELVAGMERAILDAQKRGRDVPRPMMLEWMRLRAEVGDPVEAVSRRSAAVSRGSRARKSVQR